MTIIHIHADITWYGLITSYGTCVHRPLVYILVYRKIGATKWSDGVHMQAAELPLFLKIWVGVLTSMHNFHYI